ncbi:bifunctional DNA-formamidopyrimidine glycosylase/DNA-(apurinic or apyrimidinic site) lyase [Levilactobacillus bambusae]|uniref:Formamidopyrimidine-DNA glycosylase n=1 Tax=Levilactobacillus bambusae TaxID=2024736 RepID=A0A2V1N3L9_9LACO|nr:bifunctional DNA-formamidopyrimidine glycosylase/DNA-(apurinic or apyrimidinic site) lyase [Levilactobacillus bambusae]PWG01038.1 DNA-formamidopyrimidine glycosylase [Levilactobacillus bambusae]
MPELPEVETVRRGLTELVGGATIDHVTVNYEKMISPDSPEFELLLEGRTLEQIDRRGKYLLFRFNGGLTMVSHLRMEGKYDVQPEGAPIAKHTHVIFHLTDGRELRYMDSRKFGRMALLPTGQEDQLSGIKRLGPEPTPTTLTLAYMKQEFSKSRQAIKPFLLDQSHITGLGNIYVDETLWMTKIHPLTPAKLLTDDELAMLRLNILNEIELAIANHGTTVHSFSTAYGNAGSFQNSLHVYGRAGEPCERCGTLIEKTKVAQRGTSFCPYCQIQKELIKK